MDWLPWAPLAAAVIHISEEFLLPGGFAAWYRRYSPDSSRITSRMLIIVNGILLIVCVNIGMLGRTTIGMAYWLAISALLASNGLWHAWAALRSHSYSPGVVTGTAICLPLAVCGFITFAGSGAISPGVAVLAALIGASYQIWSALYHGRFHKQDVAKR